MSKRKSKYAARSNPPCQRRGAALVEFAVVAPFLMLMLIGMIEFGRVIIVQQSLTTAAREAAREAVLPGATTESVETAATTYINLVNPNSVEIAITPALTAVEPGDAVTVDLGVSISSISKLASVWFGQQFPLSGKAVMRKEGYQ